MRESPADIHSIQQMEGIRLQLQSIIGPTNRIGGFTALADSDYRAGGFSTFTLLLEQQHMCVVLHKWVSTLWG